ncbi:MAG: hypothetical protein LC792_00750 [Actinobacteria bacterium]|nr:hypothetical protein [Actinomycetota bacterium]
MTPNDAYEFFVELVSQLFHAFSRRRAPGYGRHCLRLKRRARERPPLPRTISERGGEFSTRAGWIVEAGQAGRGCGGPAPELHGEGVRLGAGQG